VFKWSKIASLVCSISAVASPLMAQDPAVPTTVDSGVNILTGTPIGAGLIILGAAFGISRIGSAAVESMARQPEVAGNIQTGMIISAALIEGATFFALIVLMIS
jgi:F-type H+-transporting ATPase subunit c